MKETDKRHELTVRIEPVDDRFEASIEEPWVEVPHWTISGPILRYEEAVDEVADALKRHLLARR